MRRWPFFWHIFPSFLLITFLACGFIIAYATNAARANRTESAARTLRVRSVLLERELRAWFSDSSQRSAPALADLGERTHTRITLVLSDGTVIADSHHNRENMDNHADRPEVMQACEGDTGMSIRYSATLKRDLMYVAVPVHDSTGFVGVLRASQPLVSVYEALRTFAGRLVAAGIAVAAVVVLLSLGIAQRLSKPLKDITAGAERFAQGDLSQGIEIPNTREAARLAAAMNAMAEQLDERIRTITRKSNEQDAILGAMVEGVVAVDQDENVIMMNDAAGKMLGVDPMEARGRSIQEAVRNSELQRFIAGLLDSRSSHDGEISASVSFEGERHIVVHGTTLRGSRGDLKGVLAALHDVTELKKLENLRREFVANVSHELRTPLTSIKGFVETLLDGAVDNREDRVRFLRIIGNHVNRLSSLVDDLFTISRLEKEGTSGGIVLEPSAISPLVSDAVEVCVPLAQEKGTTVEVSCDSSLRANLNASLFEQALINLVDNAIKYSDSGSRVSISCEVRGREIAVAVSDNGPGISPQHHARLFERFYRIDKARSSKMGGTGLGLSIVKHIMNVHGGRVSVSSEVGAGSCFTIFVPAAAGTSEGPREQH
jgi:two-component system phosphate regulon sensor histidine kinase PhoR